MQCMRKWIAVGLLLAAPVLLAQNPGPSPVPNQAPPNQVPQNPGPQNPGPPNQGPQNQGPQGQGPQNQAPPNQAPRVASPPVAPGATPPASANAQSKTHKVPKELVLPPLPSGPLPQMPMDQIPATPAKVNLQNGLLTISAENSTLGEILRDVRKLTGAVIDIPPGAGANERVVAHLGPGAPRDVLAVLLNGSSFNYVMIGSSANPSAVSSVILTSKGGDSQTQTASNGFESSPSPGAPPMGGPMPPNRFAANLGSRPGRAENQQPAEDNNDEAATDDQEAADDTAVEDQAQQVAAQPAPPDATANPAANVNANPNPQDQQPDANQPNAGPKTPEQILEMLRRQQPPGAATPPQQPPQ
jgi:hypothetical protein